MSVHVSFAGQVEEVFEDSKFDGTYALNKGDKPPHPSTNSCVGNVLLCLKRRV